VRSAQRQPKTHQPKPTLQASQSVHPCAARSASPQPERESAIFRFWGQVPQGAPGGFAKAP
jgi:hypothetical protein